MALLDLGLPNNKRRAITMTQGDLPAVVVRASPSIFNSGCKALQGHVGIGQGAMALT